VSVSGSSKISSMKYLTPHRREAPTEETKNNPKTTKNQEFENDACFAAFQSNADRATRRGRDERGGARRVGLCVTIVVVPVEERDERNGHADRAAAQQPARGEVVGGVDRERRGARAAADRDRDRLARHLGSSSTVTLKC